MPKKKKGSGTTGKQSLVTSGTPTPQLGDFSPMAGKGDGWDKLKKNIRAELNEDLLEKFHGTVSLPFEAGDNKKAAVKIVDDHGIESLKIILLE